MNEQQEEALFATGTPEPAAPSAEDAKNPLLVALGDRVRNLRAQRGLTRKAVAMAADVSERHLANLEYGTGNASILVLQQVAAALHCPLAVPFIELSREIETLAGCSVREIHDLYGATAYRRYERRALEEAVQIHSEVVIATPGGIVSDPATFNELLAHCTTVWLRAAPEEHMGRVLAQGDMRPMAASKEAMDDLKRILDGRAAFYSKADITIDTSGQTPDQSLQALQAGVRKVMAQAA